MNIESYDVWDKTFPKSKKVSHSKITFTNRFGITLVADQYVPKTKSKEKLIGIAMSGPYGAVKEQVSGLYAQKLAELGFLTIAFDPSFTGESGGFPRNVASPDINTEDFQAAVDYLITNPLVDPTKVGILGICGWGGFALNTASIETRIKFTIASTMYNMSRVNHCGYFDSMKEDDLYKLKETLNNQRTIDYVNKTYQRAGGVKGTIDEDDPFFVKDYHDYYKTKRGYHPRSLGSNEGFNLTTSLSFINTPINTYLEDIKSAVLLIHGEKAHSFYFSQDAFKQLKGKNKEFIVIPNAVHTDLYYKLDVIPFDKIKEFILKNV